MPKWEFPVPVPPEDVIVSEGVMTTRKIQKVEKLLMLAHI